MVRTLYASAARTATPTAVNVNTSRAKCLRLFLDVTAVTATPALTVTIDAWDSVSNRFVNLLTSAAVATVSTTMLTIGVGVTVAANVSASTFLGDFVRVTVTHGDADSATYSLTAHIIR